MPGKDGIMLLKHMLVALKRDMLQKSPSSVQLILDAFTRHLSSPNASLLSDNNSRFAGGEKQVQCLDESL